MTIKREYLIFLNNKNWYYFDEEEWKYKLTDKAPKEAVESYKKFYDFLNSRNKEA